jgi:hypothetical protein
VDKEPLTNKGRDDLWFSMAVISHRLYKVLEIKIPRKDLEIDGILTTYNHAAL